MKIPGATSLRTRLVVGLGLVMTALLAVLFMGSVWLVLGKFDRLERQRAEQQMTRALQALDGLAEELLKSAADWGHWDASVQFVQDRNEGFAEENLVANALVDLGIDVLLMVDSECTLVWGKALAQEGTAFADPPAGLLALLGRDGAIHHLDVHEQATAGFVRLPEGTMMLAAHPIRRSTGEGTSRGLIIMGRIVNEAFVEQLALDLIMDLSLHPLQGAMIFPDGQDVVVRPPEGGVLPVFGSVVDFWGQPALALRLAWDRAIHREGVRTVAFFGVLLVVIGALSAGVLALLLDRQVVDRLLSLSREVRRMAAREGDPVPMVLEGSDELTGLAQDINQLVVHRKEARHTLRESQRQYQSLFEKMLNGFALHEIICDAQGKPTDYRFLAVNPAFEQMTGLKAVDVVGKRALEVLPSLEPAWIEAYGRVALTGEPATMEAYTAALGRHYRVSIFRPAPRQFAAIIEDVTARKEAEERNRALQEERRRAEEEKDRTALRFRALIENAPDGIVLLDRASRMQFASPSARRMFGLGPEDEVAAIEPSDLTHPEDLPRVLDALKQLMEQPGRIPVVEYRFRHRDGGWLWVESAFSNLLGVPGVEAIVINFRNITERKQAEEEREHLQTQLLQAQKMESVGRLAGGVAHDFNNMLQAILGHVELLSMRLQGDTEASRDLEEIGSAARRSADLTRQLLAFARRQTVLPRVLDLNEAVAGMLGMLRRLLGEDIELVWRPGPGPLTVKMDSSQIDQILANLTVNARDAIAGVGRLEIETRRIVVHPDEPAPLSELAPGCYVMLSVTDNGCGISPDIQTQLFEPFFTTKPLGSGTGLGLSTVYGIAKQNRGAVHVASAVGQGSTFTVYLPIHEAAPAFRPAVVEAVEPPHGSETIMVVEDEPSIRLTVKRFLESLGYTALIPEGAEDALAVSMRHAGDIHLLITDVIMPGLSGRAVADRLMQQRSGMKCLFISGYSTDVIAQRGVVGEGVAFLHKPFSRDDLARKIREILG